MTNEDPYDRLAHLQELVKVHARRLKLLELKAAKYGEMKCPIDVEYDIEETREKLDELHTRVNVIKTSLDRTEFKVEINNYRRDIEVRRPLMLTIRQGMLDKLKDSILEASRYSLGSCPEELLNVIIELGFHIKQIEANYVEYSFTPKQLLD